MGTLDRLNERLTERLAVTPPPEPAYRALLRLRRALRSLRERVLPADAIVIERTMATLEPRALGLAAEWDLGRLLHDGPRTTQQLAETLDVDAVALGRVLALLAASGVVRESGRRWHRTRLSEVLRDDHPRSARNWARFFGGRELFELVASLDVPASGGVSAMRDRHDEEFFAWTGAVRPDVGERFDAAMADGSRFTGPMLAGVVDWTGTQTVCDIGGGTGRVLGQVLAANPSLRGILFDQPGVVDDPAPELSDVGDRAERVGGDFFVAVPEADTYLLVAIIHDWGDDEARRILASCAEAMQPTADGGPGRIIVVDFIVDPARPPFLEHHTDVLMLALTDGGRERSVADLARLAAPAGLTPRRVWPLTGVSAVELVRTS